MGNLENNLQNYGHRWPFQKRHTDYFSEKFNCKPIKDQDFVMVNVAADHWVYGQICGLSPRRVYDGKEVYDCVEDENIKPIQITDVVEKFAVRNHQGVWLVDGCFCLRPIESGGFIVSLFDRDNFLPGRNLSGRIRYLHELQECYRTYAGVEVDYGWFLLRKS